MFNKKIIVRQLALAFAAGSLVPAAHAADETQTILVTAQSRKQSVQDVPIAMQVVTMKDIETLGANDLSDLNGYIPGLSVDSSEPTQPGFGIRGVNPGDFGIATDAPVGIYVDGVYTGKTGGALMNFVDVSRIEVIKGPQGTLFGRNSAAGAISITTAEPTQDTDMSFRALVGKYGRGDAEVMFNTPISDTSAARFVFVRAASDGWIDNAATGKTSGGDNSWATRMSVKKNYGQTKVLLSWEHERMKQDGRPVLSVIDAADGIPFVAKAPASAVIDGLAGMPGLTSMLLGAGLASTPIGVLNSAAFMNPAAYRDPRKLTLANDVQGSEWRDFDGVTLRVELPLGNVMLNSTTAYRGFDTFNYTDNDGSARSDAYLATLDAKSARSWQQEFKLSGTTGSLDWIGGVSFYDNKESQDAGAYLTTGSLVSLTTLQGVYAPLEALGAGALAPGDFAAAVGPNLGFLQLLGALPGNLPWRETTYAGVKTKSYSLYGDVIWHATDSTNVTAGLRWTHDNKHASWHVPVRDSAQLDATIAMAEAAGVVPPGTGSMLPPNIVFADAVLRGAGTPVSTEHTWTDLSPRLVFDHKLSKDTLVFASVSKGYQAGGYNIFVPNPSDDKNGRFEPEKMTNLELGFKTLFPALKATLNASLFHYDFKNLQEIELITPAGGGIPTYNVVVSDQKATGIDFDGKIKLTSNVNLFAGGEWIDQTYSRYIDSDGNDLKGEAVGTPRLSVMGGVNVTWSALGGYSSFTLQGTHSSKHRCNAGSGLGCLTGASFKTGEAQTKVDLRLGWENADRRFGTALVVNNLLDKRYVNSLGGQTEQLGLPYAYITPPRFVGIEFKANL